MNRKLLRFIDCLPIGCSTALLFSIIAVLTLMPSKDVPSVSIPNIDKLVHCLMFGALSCVMIFDSGRYSNKLTAKTYILCAIVATAIGGMIELAQGAMSFGRGAEWADLLADAVGAFLLPLLFGRLLKELVDFHSLALYIVEKGGKIPSCMESLYLSSFPPEERRPWGNILELTSKSPIFRFTLLRSGGKPAGFITWWKLSDAVYVEHFAVMPSMRSRGIGGAAMQKFCEERGKTPVVLEVEPEGTDAIARRRIGFYERCGFTAHPQFPYTQPPYEPGLPSVALMLMTYGSTPCLEKVASEIHSTVYGVTKKSSAR